MRKKPTYDDLWFYEHDPFLKIMEKYCGLVLEKERRPYYQLGFREYSNHYHIKYSLVDFIKNIVEIKNVLLNTNVCKHNIYIREQVEEIDTTWNCEDNYNYKEIGHTVSFIICEGCIKEPHGTFHWTIEKPTGWETI